MPSVLRIRAKPFAALIFIAFPPRGSIVCVPRNPVTPVLSRGSGPAGEDVELAAAHARAVGLGGDGAGEIGGVELAIVVHPEDPEPARLEELFHLLGIQQPVLGRVHDLGLTRDLPRARTPQAAR